MSSFAKDTSVSVQKTRMEIECLLEKHRATRTFTGIEEGRAVIGFEYADRRVQFELKLPLLESFKEKRHRGRSWPVKLSPEQQRKEWEQACRTVWRGLLLTIKAKFVSIEAGVESFEEAFLAQVVIPGTGRFGTWAKLQLERAYGTGQMLPMLPAGDA